MGSVLRTSCTPNLLCKHVLLGEHHLTFSPETLKSEYISHCPVCSQDMEEQNTNSISGLLLVKGFPNLAFSGAFPVSRRVKNAHRQMKGVLCVSWSRGADLYFIGAEARAVLEPGLLNWCSSSILS